MSGKTCLLFIDRLYTVEEYARYIVQASNKGNLKNNLIDSKLFVHFKDWWPKIYKKNVLSVKSVPKKWKDAVFISYYSMFNYNKPYMY